MGLGHRPAPGQPLEASKVELRGSAEILGCPWWDSAETVGVLRHRAPVLKQTRVSQI